MLEKLEVVRQMVHGFAYREFFTAHTARKLALILANHVGDRAVLSEAIALARRNTLDQHPVAAVAPASAAAGATP